MKSLKEIGFKKALRFGIYTILLEVFKLMIFPQLRKPYLRLLGAKIGKNTIIHSVKFFNYYANGFRNFEVGNNCFIGDDSLFDLANPMILEDNVTIAERVMVLSHTNVGYKDHPLQKKFARVDKPVIFRKGCFIGAGALILPGIRVGINAFVGGVRL